MDNVKRIINFKKLAEVVRNNRLEPIQKMLLIDLLLYAGTSGEAFPSQQTLAKDFGCSTRQVRYSLDMLYAVGLVKRKRRGFAKSNTYFLNEELYFHNDKSNRNTSSSHSGNKVPHNLGTPVPPNETQLINSSNGIKKIKSDEVNGPTLREKAFENCGSKYALKPCIKTVKNPATKIML